MNGSNNYHLLEVTKSLYFFFLLLTIFHRRKREYTSSWGQYRRRRPGLLTDKGQTITKKKSASFFFFLLLTFSFFHSFLCPFALLYFLFYRLCVEHWIEKPPYIKSKEMKRKPLCAREADGPVRTVHSGPAIAAHMVLACRLGYTVHACWTTESVQSWFASIQSAWWMVCRTSWEELLDGEKKNEEIRHRRIDIDLHRFI